MKIKFNSDDNLPLKLLKLLKVYNLTIVVRSVFQEGNKYYSHIFRWMFVWVTKCCITIRLMLQKELTLIQKNIGFFIIGTLKILVINLNHKFVIDVMIY